jgi:hypothetical protein
VAAQETPKWATAARDRPPITVDQAKAFMKRLAQFAVEHHMKRDARSPQRGMMYEYWEPKKAAQYDQFVQGEALDTMHDGAWFGVAMVEAYRATGDAYYKSILTDDLLPFYCRMLNHSDELFLPDRNDARPEKKDTWGGGHEWLLERGGEKGFVPYWWDDGGSVSLERVQNRNALGDFPCHDDLVARGQPNPKYLLSGYSLGSSNHLAQDLGVLLEASWLLLRDDPKWDKDLTEAARNLEQCRTKHGSPNIPAVLAPAALSANDARLLARLPDPDRPQLWEPDNHYTRALRPAKAGEKTSAPGFADEDEFLYYAGIARAGGRLPKPIAFKLVFDACTQPMLYRYYCDDEPAPPGISVFDLHPYYWTDGKPLDYRSQRKGPSKQPRPVGSRLGPQNMVVSGWALEALRAYPGIWEERYKSRFANDLRVHIDEGNLAPENEPATVPLTLGGTLLAIRSSRNDLQLAGEATGPSVVIDVFAGPDATGEHAAITIDLAKGVSAVNGSGRPLRVTGAVERGDKGARFEVSLPYTVTNGQSAWANGIEHGRYSIRIGNQSRNFYLASAEAQVKADLERELGGGLRTWEAVFDELGYIPTGMGEVRWQRFSDTGGYAHLIKAASQWILYLSKQDDWEIHRVPIVR